MLDLKNLFLILEDDILTKTRKQFLAIASDIAAVGPIFNVLDSVRAKGRIITFSMPSGLLNVTHVTRNAALGPTLNVLSYDAAVRVENRTHHWIRHSHGLNNVIHIDTQFIALKAINKIDPP